MSKNKAILWEELNWKDIIRKAYNENESGNHSASSPSDLGGGVFRGALLVSQVFNDGYTARAVYETMFETRFITVASIQREGSEVTMNIIRIELHLDYPRRDVRNRMSYIID